tara:strand:+ start:316 stop:687 length:372 start_codon:yes stop_codon:yes gene_type:complete
MLETLYLADREVAPCEVVEFEIVATNQESYVGGFIHTLFVTPTNSSLRFSPKKIYIIRTTTFKDGTPSLALGFYSRTATLVLDHYAQQLVAGDKPTADYVDAVVDGGVFYSSRSRALHECSLP